MRTLFFLLIAANLSVYLYFHYEARARAGADIDPIPEGAPSVVLLSEFRDAPAPSGADEVRGRVEVRSGSGVSAAIPATDPSTPVGSDGAAGSAAARKRCLVLGPFQDRTEARELRTSLERLGFDVRSKVVDGSQPAERYRILIRPLATAAEAQQVMVRLREKDIRDISLGRGNEATAVLLGYYKSPVLAEQRRRRIASYGFAPVVEPMRKSVRSFTLFYELLQDEPSLLPESLAKYRPKSSVVDCKVVL